MRYILTIIRGTNRAGRDFYRVQGYITGTADRAAYQFQKSFPTAYNLTSKVSTALSPFAAVEGGFQVVRRISNLALQQNEIWKPHIEFYARWSSFYFITTAFYQVFKQGPMNWSAAPFWFMAFRFGSDEIFTNK